MSITTTNGLRIVSFDGSGIRGISQLEVFRNIMHRIQRDTYPEDPDKIVLPCEYFDLMGGSDTGGLIALLFTKCRMSVDEVIDAFSGICENVYLDSSLDAVERSSQMSRCLEDILRDKELPLDLKLGQDKRVTNETKCACDIQKGLRSGHLSYLRYAILATCAIEPSFLPVTIGPRLRQQIYISGNISGVNPSKQVLSEAYALFGGSGRLACFLSLGPGPIDILSMYPDGPADVHECSSLLQAAIVDHKKVEHEIATKVGDSGVYFRFSAVHFLQGKENDKDLGSILTKTNVYLRDIEISRKIDACVECCRLTRGLITLEPLESSHWRGPVYKDFPSPTKHFVARSEPWNAMKINLIEAVSDEEGQKVMVISDMGGCGKTQLVAQFMKEYRTWFQYACFIDGSSREAVEVDLINSVQRLGAYHSPITLDDALDFFCNPDHDNGFLCMTMWVMCRSQLLGRLASHNDFHVKLGPMSDEEAIESIYKSSELEESEETQPSMASIATELGNLPVALIQVGSYILRTTCTPNEYLKKLQKHKAELMKTSTGDREDRSAYAAFDISYQRLPHLIRHFLHILSHMHYCDFPLEVVIHAAQDNFRLRPFSFPGKSEDYERERKYQSRCGLDCYYSSKLFFGDILPDLCRSSSSDTSSESSLVRDSQSSSKKAIYRAAAMRLVVNALTAKQFYVYLVPHIVALVQQCTTDTICLGDLGAFGTILMRAQRTKEAGVAWGRVCKALILKDTMSSLIVPRSRRNPITWFKNDGFWKNPDTCPVEYREFHEDIRCLEDINTLTALANYAAVCNLQRIYKVAEDILQCVMNQMGKNLGPNDEETLKAKGELVLIYQVQNKYSKAKLLQEDILLRLQDRFGDDHPDVISAMANLAITIRSLGTYNGAQELQEKIVEKNKVRHGGTHWETLKSMINLAKTLYAQGQFASAMKLQENVWNERKSQLEESHLKTLDAMAHLALTYRSLGEYSSAESRQLFVLDERRKQLGEFHVSTLEAMDQLSTTYHSQGRYAIAARMQEQSQYFKAISGQKQVVKLRKASLGKRHPETLEAMTNLSITYLQTGNYSEALQLQEEVLAQREKLLGDSHPETLRARLNIADTYQSMGNFTTASTLQNDVIGAITQLYGKDHPDTLEAISRLAITYRTQGSHHLCETLQKEVLEERTKQLGEDHPIVQRAIANLAKTHKLQGRYDTAAQMLRGVFNWRDLHLGMTHLDTVACLEELLDVHDLTHNYLDALILVNNLIAALETEIRSDENIENWEIKFMELSQKLNMDQPGLHNLPRPIFTRYMDLKARGVVTKESLQTIRNATRFRRRASQSDREHGGKRRRIGGSRDESSGDERSGESSADDISP
ncbi:TPR-like protein [Serendipita vermifera]|nr:TPR-like protein [Serendipita vermifera]